MAFFKTAKSPVGPKVTGSARKSASSTASAPRKAAAPVAGNLALAAGEPDESQFSKFK
jgi:hypothetical protein